MFATREFLAAFFAGRFFAAFLTRFFGDLRDVDAGLRLADAVPADFFFAMVAAT
jgi:hypothetical protein